MTKLYGIKNCDTVKKARKWLEQQGITYEFCDVREQPVDQVTLEHWLESVGDSLINRRSTTWKQLDDLQKAQANGNAVALLGANPTLIKRPVLEIGKQVHIGFSADQYQSLFN